LTRDAPLIVHTTFEKRPHIRRAVSNRTNDWMWTGPLQLITLGVTLGSEMAVPRPRAALQAPGADNSNRLDPWNKHSNPADYRGAHDALCYWTGSRQPLERIGNLMRIKIGALAVVSLLLLLFAPAHAASLSDPNDTRGRLDIFVLRASGARHGMGRFSIETQRRFGCNKLKLGKPNRLKLLFDDQRDGDIDLVGRFYCFRGSYSHNHWYLRLHGPSSGSHYEELRATRPDRHTINVAVPLDLLEFVGSHLGVLARSKDATAAACTSKACRDRAPDAGNLKVY
jgi:hypothetical protein